MKRQIGLLLTAVIAVSAIVILINTSGPRESEKSFRPADLDENQLLARDIFRQLIEIDTTHSTGDTTVAANAMADRLLSAGFAAENVRVLGEIPNRGNLVARLRGNGNRDPILLLAHLDVIEAEKSDWSFDPFVFLEQDGFFYGRGTADDKAQAAIWIANLMRMKNEGYVPNRDIVVALTADEEGGDNNGVDWLLKNHRELIEAEYALNEGGMGLIIDGKKVFNSVQVSEKVFQSYRIDVRNRGGHSSRPSADNAIYELAHALLSIAGYKFPVIMNDGTRLFFQNMASTQPPTIAADMLAIAQSPSDPDAAERLATNPALNAMMRTTCVATMLSGGHAENALPQLASAVINCRILPGESPEEVRAKLLELIANDQIEMTSIWDGVQSDPSPLLAELFVAVEEISGRMWPEVIVTPIMATGATDGLYLRNAGIPTYGVNGMFFDIADTRAHGMDERIAVQSFFEGQEFLNQLVRDLSSE
jgi:acetylornithine deacetylase/succinyl-diaminopimelate desuccinylase-like protein